MGIVEILICSLVTVILANELSLFFVAGWFAKKSTLQKIERLAEEKFCLNSYNKNILILGSNMDFQVAHFGFIPGLLSYYYVSQGDVSFGRIPIWSSTHFKVVDLFRKSKNPS